jgi:hypothetical protein
MVGVAQHDPDALRRMLRRNANGTYTITFADGTPVTVSPELVVHPDDLERPVFVRSGEDAAWGTELWPLLIEKAYAQYHGGWGDTVGGHPAGAVLELVGGEIRGREPASLELADLQADLDAGRPLLVSTLRTPDGFVDLDPDERRAAGFPEPYVDDRLVGRHAYVITDVDVRGGRVTVTNPWNSERNHSVLTIDELRASARRVEAVELPGGP